MKTNANGEIFFEVEDVLCELYRNPSLDLSDFVIWRPDDAIEDDPIEDELQKFKLAVMRHFEEYPHQLRARERLHNESRETFDKRNQREWKCPDDYMLMDIAKWLLDQCETETELQRVAEELLLYEERDMLPLLCYLKYFVDTMRENNKVWGVGRGSSVASYVLFLIGVHKIDSIYYDLDIKEFLR